MNFKNFIFSTLLIAGVISCKKDNKAPVNYGNFVVAVTPVAATAVADYLLTASSLDTGIISTKKNGVEQDGTYRYYVTHQNKLFSMLYGQGNPGAVTVYNLEQGNLNKISNAVTETVQAFAPVNDDILLMKISRNVTNPTTSWYQFNTKSLQIEKQGTINSLELNNNGELAFFSWIKQVGNKVYAPYFSIKGCCSATFGTAYPDQAWIAVYSYPEMKLEKIIKDDRTSFIGRYFTDGLEELENGDVYAFSSNIASANGNSATFNSTKPSSVTRLKAGQTEFDKSYLLDFEALSGGLNITNWIYVGNNKFVVLSNTKEKKGAYNTGTIVGILDVNTKSYQKVTGLPEQADIKSISSNNYSAVDGKYGYIGVNLTSGLGYIYRIDVNNATSTMGLKVDGGTITAIEYLN
ncbi:DUF4374 domain-containing protein [Sphingobacterium sp. HJSM2_6]|uniref:DUF4374 domain-containing protein n=1 Tax=Sphingobacterium sp. HJSM2_6 TaxID=3366264 RepID=UPI003BBD3075